MSKDIRNSRVKRGELISLSKDQKEERYERRVGGKYRQVCETKDQPKDIDHPYKQSRSSPYEPWTVTGKLHELFTDVGYLHL